MSRSSAGSTIWTLLGAVANSQPALIAADDGWALTSIELVDRVADLASRLRAQGVKRGDRVAVLVPEGPEFAQIVLALMAGGAAAAPLNPAYTPAELEFFLGDVQPSLALASGTSALADVRGFEGQVLEVRGRGADGVELHTRGSACTERAPFEDAEPEDVALLLHTSGTTSTPKQVPLLQRNICASVSTVVDHYALSDADVSYVAMPLFHVHGFVASLLAPLASGGAVVVPTRLAARRLWDHVATYSPTWFSAAPTLHRMILDKREGRTPSEAIRFVRSCSSPLAPLLMAEAEDIYGAPVLEAYGMTEASHQISSNPLPPGRRLPGSVGVATGPEVRVVDAEWQAVSEGEEGEVAIRGANVTPGYLGQPDANEECFQDGWFRTGDLGALDGGYLWLKGRIKELILRGGENVSPFEIENVLRSHPAIDDAAVFGIPDELYGESVAAAVVLKSDATERALLAHCRESLASFKIPARIVMVPSLPRTTTGKVQRKKLAAAFASPEFPRRGPAVGVGRA